MTTDPSREELTFLVAWFEESLRMSAKIQPVDLLSVFLHPAPFVVVCCVQLMRKTGTQQSFTLQIYNIFTLERLG